MNTVYVTGFPENVSAHKVSELFGKECGQVQSSGFLPGDEPCIFVRFSDPGAFEKAHRRTDLVLDGSTTPLKVLIKPPPGANRNQAKGKHGKGGWQQGSDGGKGKGDYQAGGASGSRQWTDQKGEGKGKSSGPSPSIWIGNLPTGVTEDRLRKEFEKFGTIRSAVVRGQNDRKAHAYVNFTEVAVAEKAIEEMNRSTVFGEAINVSFSKNPPRGPDSGPGSTGPHAEDAETARRRIDLRPGPGAKARKDAADSAKPPERERPDSRPTAPASKRPAEERKVPGRAERRDGVTRPDERDRDRVRDQDRDRQHEHDRNRDRRERDNRDRGVNDRPRQDRDRSRERDRERVRDRERERERDRERRDRGRREPSRSRHESRGRRSRSRDRRANRRDADRDDDRRNSRKRARPASPGGDRRASDKDSRQKAAAAALAAAEKLPSKAKEDDGDDEDDDDASQDNGKRGQPKDSSRRDIAKQGARGAAPGAGGSGQASAGKTPKKSGSGKNLLKIENLPPDMTKEELRTTASDFAEVLLCEVSDLIDGARTGELQFESADDLELARKKFDRRRVEGWERRLHAFIPSSG